MSWTRPWRALPGAGCSRGRDYDRLTVAVMRRVLRRDANCVDVGAHQGEILRHMVHLAPEGVHTAFEPLPAFHGVLLRKFPGVHVHRVALSDCAGTRRFQHVVTNPAYSGFLRRQYERVEQVEEIEVQTGRLDDLLPQEMVISLVKIDVEGAELEVLRGGTATLRRSRPALIFEHGLGAADCYGTRPEQVYDLLVDHCTLPVFVIEDWLQGRPALDRQQFVDQFERGLNYMFLACPSTR
jgi:FkbM family methyltransferase